MKQRVLIFAAIAGCGLFLATGQEPAQPGVFTAAQAEAGRTAYLNTCGKCHLESLLGRTGDPKEMPAVDSLPAVMKKVVLDAGGVVPPLAGPEFLEEWGARTTRELSQRIKTAVGGFPPQGSDKQTY